MVGNITSFTGNGVRDWFLQRVTAVLVGVYTIVLMGFIVMHPEMDFSAWQSLFANTCMRLFTLITLISILIHAWIGMWTVSTDYIKPTWLRVSFQVIVFVSLLALTAWGVEILWGI